VSHDKVVYRWISARAALIKLIHVSFQRAYRVIVGNCILVSADALAKAITTNYKVVSKKKIAPRSLLS